MDGTSLRFDSFSQIQRIAAPARGEASKPPSELLRAFAEEQYAQIKIMNPNLPFLLRTNEDIEPKLFVSYGLSLSLPAHSNHLAPDVTRSKRRSEPRLVWALLLRDFEHFEESMPGRAPQQRAQP